MRQSDSVQIPESIDYLNIKGLRAEAAQKLTELKPTTIGQASRISGVNPADVSILMVYSHARRCADRLRPDGHADLDADSSISRST
jgi:tRNA uridine 5-carboxymethylaminomethyl modification enzyme